MGTNFANVVLLVHLSVVLFVIGGLLAILLGALRKWHWVRNPWFRTAHIAVIGVVIFETWFGVPCPLTTLESWLRRGADGAAYERGFVEHWVGRCLFYDAPGWMFAGLYTVFAAVVLAAWRYYPPTRFERRPRQGNR